MTGNVMQMLDQLRSENQQLREQAVVLTKSLSDLIVSSQRSLDWIELLVNFHDQDNPIGVVQTLVRLSNHRKAVLAKRVH